MSTAKPGEKKLLILQTIAHLLELPAGGKITTALLAKKEMKIVRLSDWLTPR